MNNSIGLLAAAFAVFFLASPVTASACDAADSVMTESGGDDSATGQAERERALESEKAAANSAADRLHETTRLDLDIRLIGHISKIVVASR